MVSSKVAIESVMSWHAPILGLLCETCCLVGLAPTHKCQSHRWATWRQVSNAEMPSCSRYRKYRTQIYLCQCHWHVLGRMLHRTRYQISVRSWELCAWFQWSENRDGQLCQLFGLFDRAQYFRARQISVIEVPIHELTNVLSCPIHIFHRLPVDVEQNLEATKAIENICYCTMVQSKITTVICFCVIKGVEGANSGHEAGSHHTLAVIEALILEGLVQHIFLFLF